MISKTTPPRHDLRASETDDLAQLTVSLSFMRALFSLRPVLPHSGTMDDIDRAAKLDADLKYLQTSLDSELCGDDAGVMHSNAFMSDDTLPFMMQRNADPQDDPPIYKRGDTVRQCGDTAVLRVLRHVRIGDEAPHGYVCEDDNAGIHAFFLESDLEHHDEFAEKDAADDFLDGDGLADDDGGYEEDEHDEDDLSDFQKDFKEL